MVAERNPQRLGRGGELIAMGLLLAKGYRLRHRNWRGPRGEIDLVMESRGQLVFVEVKTRSHDRLGGAMGAFGTTKQSAVAHAAAAYLSRYGQWDRPCRFDLVAIERTAKPPWWRIRHVRNAFSPDQGRLLA